MLDPESTPEPTDTGEADLDTPQLTERMWYLLMLLRRQDGAPGRGRGPGRGHGHGNRFQGQGRVLRLLSLHSPITQRELAYILGIRPQSLAEQIGKLEAAGLLTRTPNPEDRRTSIVELTEAGRAASNAADVDTEPDAFAALNAEEKQQLSDLLDRVIANIEERLPGGPDHRLQVFKQMAFGNHEGPQGEEFANAFDRRFGGPFPGGFPDDRFRRGGRGGGRREGRGHGRTGGFGPGHGRNSWSAEMECQ